MQTVVFFLFLSNAAGQWNSVFMHSLPEEEIILRDDQDPRVSNIKILCNGMIYSDHQSEKNQLY